VAPWRRPRGSLEGHGPPVEKDWIRATFMEHWLVSLERAELLLSVIRSWTFTMVTTVRYELVQSSLVQDKLIELTRLVEKV